MDDEVRLSWGRAAIVIGPRFEKTRNTTCELEAGG